MTRYNPNKHHRRSIRLRGYDYAQAGLYFITICVQHRKHLFGEIIDGRMQCNPAGTMIERWYHALEEKFPNIVCHDMVVMPDHIHCIIEISNDGMDVGADDAKNEIPNRANTVGADRCVCPNGELGASDEHVSGVLGEHMGSPLHLYHVASDETMGSPLHLYHVASDETMGSPLHLYRVVQWFKTMTTNEYIRGVKQQNWMPFHGKLWQRNYYERIIRDERAYHAIVAYIRNNPRQWKYPSQQNQ